MPALEDAEMVPKSPASHILIADDSESSRDLLRFILERAGCEVTEACDGEEVLQRAFTMNLDLFVLDLNMPRRDGYQVAAELRRCPAFASTPIVALSAEMSLMDEDRMGEAGFSMFLSKPISPARLRECIASLLDHKRSTSY